GGQERDEPRQVRLVADERDRAFPVGERDPVGGGPPRLQQLLALRRRPLRLLVQDLPRPPGAYVGAREDDVDGGNDLAQPARGPPEFPLTVLRQRPQRVVGPAFRVAVLRDGMPDEVQQVTSSARARAARARAAS